MNDDSPQPPEDDLGELDMTFNEIRRMAEGKFIDGAVQYRISAGQLLHIELEAKAALLRREERVKAEARLEGQADAYRDVASKGGSGAAVRDYATARSAQAQAQLRQEQKEGA
jgi:hypothetical protein